MDKEIEKVAIIVSGKIYTIKSQKKETELQLVPTVVSDQFIHCKIPLEKIEKVIVIIIERLVIIVSGYATTC